MKRLFAYLFFACIILPAHGHAQTAPAAATLSTGVAPIVATTPTTTPVATPAELKNEIIYRTNLGRADDVKLLLSQGASPNEVNDQGVPLISIAAARKDSEGINVTKTLLDAGAPLDARDKNGETPLFYAAKQGNNETLDYLLKHGADLNAMNSHSDTARTSAFRAGNQDTVAAMDRFTIEKQSEAVQQQYEDANKQLEQKYLEQQASIKQAQEKLKQQAETLAQQSTKSHSAGVDGQGAPLKTTANSAPAYDPKQAAAAVHDLTLHNCAFEYWSYVHASDQSSELSSDQIRDTIKGERDKVEESKQLLIENYHIQPERIANASENVKQRMYHQLSVMPSKQYRHEKGIGKVSDEKTRCSDIADGIADIVDTIPADGGKGGIGGSNKGGHGSKAMMSKTAAKSKMPSSSKSRGNNMTPQERRHIDAAKQAVRQENGLQNQAAQPANSSGY